MPTTALLRYELALFARSFTDAFSRTRDRLLLAIVLVLALLWLRQGVSAAGGIPIGAELIALAAAAISFQWNRLVNRRLAWLAEESALAPCAAIPGARLRYRLAAQLPILLPILLAACTAGMTGGRTIAAPGLAAAAHGAGMLAARARIGSGRWSFAGRRRPAASPQLSGPRTALLALLRVQALNAGRPGRALALLLAANLLATFAASYFARGAWAGVAVAASALPSLLLLGATARNDARLAGFLAFAGHSAGSVALAVSLLPAASFAAASAGALAGGGSGGAVAALALIHLGAALIAIARAWLSPGKDARRVDFQVQLEAAGLLALTLMLPPLGLLGLVVRLAMLRDGYRASIWLQR